MELRVGDLADEITSGHRANFQNTPGDVGLTWNAYANANQGDAGITPTTGTTFRYEDNIHIRAGAPVSCAQIGFGTQAQQPPPNAPSNLHLGWLLLGEPPTALQAAGLATVLLGFYLAQRQR